MSEFAHQPALFGASAPDDVVMPELPAQPWYRRHSAAPGDRCDYCLLIEIEQRRGRSTPVRRPTWLRTGTDGATLLLCDAHADLLTGGEGESA
jgi:hypothetical protein